MIDYYIILELVKVGATIALSVILIKFAAKYRENIWMSLFMVAILIVGVYHIVQWVGDSVR